MRKRIASLVAIFVMVFSLTAASQHRQRRVPTAADTKAALEYVDWLVRQPEWKTIVDYRALGRDTIVRASAGDCDAVKRIVMYLDPADYSRWITIIEHEGANFSYGQCAPIAQLSGGPGRGLTQQTIGWNDGAGGDVTRYWHGLYYAIHVTPDAWSNAYFHMRTSVNHKNRYGWSAWNGAF